MTSFQAAGRRLGGEGMKLFQPSCTKGEQPLARKLCHSKDYGTEVLPEEIRVNQENQILPSFCFRKDLCPSY